jgi:hypothetical protein
MQFISDFPAWPLPECARPRALRCPKDQVRVKISAACRPFVAAVGTVALRRLVSDGNRRRRREESHFKCGMRNVDCGIIIVRLVTSSPIILTMAGRAGSPLDIDEHGLLALRKLRSSDR